MAVTDEYGQQNRSLTQTELVVQAEAIDPQADTKRGVEEGGLLGAVGGAVVGMLAGGPVGAIIGAVAGGAVSAAAVSIVSGNNRDRAMISPEAKADTDAAKAAPAAEHSSICGRQVQSSLHAYERD